MYESSTGFSLKPWYSHENAYLQIYRNYESGNTDSDIVDCLSQTNFNIMVKLPQNIEQATGSLFYQIQSRSKVVLSGHYDINQNKNVLNVPNNDVDRNIVSVTAVKNEEQTNDGNRHMGS